MNYSKSDFKRSLLIANPKSSQKTLNFACVDTKRTKCNFCTTKKQLYDEATKPTNNKPIYLPFKTKTGPAKFEPVTFAVPGVFITSSQVEPEITIFNFDLYEQ